MSLFQTLKPKPKTADSGCCLLLDISGSMAQRISSENESYNPELEDGLEPTRVDQMFKVVRDTPECQGLTTFVFSTRCRLLEVLPKEGEHFNTESSTNMGDAFMTVKAAGYYNAILVTDGCPDSEQSAIAAAYGMKLGIIYIGNPPVPPFLERLAKATDGTFEIADMRTTSQLQIAIQHALPAPSEDPEEPTEKKGAIQL